MRLSVTLFTAAALSNLPLPALEPEPGSAFVRVVDCGAGLCCIICLPAPVAGGESRYIVYDAGDKGYASRAAVAESLAELVPTGEQIDLLVISHPDTDHLSSVPQICENYRVARVLRTGYDRDAHESATPAEYHQALQAIASEVGREGCEDMSLAEVNIAPGEVFEFGETTLTFVCGFNEPPDEWGFDPSDDQALRRNSVSICLRLEHADRSVLFTGDAVGRAHSDAAEEITATERHMVDNAGEVTIDSDVLIAPNHGANSASSLPFIEAVSPTHVVFSAGHRHRLPNAVAAGRYQRAGLLSYNMLRTDFRDDEGWNEWRWGRWNGHRDGARDDNVDILITSDGELTVAYDWD